MTDGAIALELSVEHGQTSFEPGGRVSGVAGWKARIAPPEIELQLVWTSHGWGGRDFKIVETVTFAAPLPEERRPFILALPDAPYSFRGTLISLGWALELVALPGLEKVRVDLTVAPGRRAVELG